MEHQTNINNHSNGQLPAPPLKYCLYARKSTEQDEKQTLSIDSQIKEMQEIASKEGLFIADIRKESHSAKAVGQRPVYNQIIADIKSGKFNALLTWAPDRLSRNAGDLGAIVDMIDQKILVEVRTYSQRFTDSPNEKFLLMILGSQAKLENDNKSLNVKRGMRARAEMGLWPAIAPTGYLNEKRTDRKCHVVVDPKRAPIIKQIFEKVGEEQWSGRKIYRWLKETGFKTHTGKILALSNIFLILKQTFYYGVFEWPKHSDKWYTGQHTPLISKELFDKVQQQLTIEKQMTFGKEFAFTRLIYCAYCGSGVTAEEKFKNLKDGSVTRHVYYRCTKSRDVDCKNQPLKEDALTEEALQIIDKISLNKLGIKEKLEKEVERFTKFQTGVLGIKGSQEIKDKGVNIKNYAKYLLREGNNFEKREILSCIKSRLLLKDKKLILG